MNAAIEKKTDEGYQVPHPSLVTTGPGLLRTWDNVCLCRKVASK
jgi:hypothetical protein